MTRSVLTLAAALLLTACGATPAPLDSDTDAGGGGDDTDVVSANFHHGVVRLRILKSEQAMDLDGDGDEENVLGTPGQKLNAGIETALGNATQGWVLQLWGVSGPTDDDVEIGMFEAERVSADGGVNGIPQARAVAGSLTADGKAGRAEASALAAGEFSVVLTNPRFSAGPIVFEALNGLHVVGDANAAGSSGAIGIAADVAALASALRAEDQAEVADGVEAAADIDLDEDGTPEGVSIVLGFEATKLDLVE